MRCYTNAGREGSQMAPKSAGLRWVSDSWEGWLGFFGSLSGELLNPVKLVPEQFQPLQSHITTKKLEENKKKKSHQTNWKNL